MNWTKIKQWLFPEYTEWEFDCRFLHKSNFYGEDDYKGDSLDSPTWTRESEVTRFKRQNVHTGKWYYEDESRTIKQYKNWDLVPGSKFSI